MQLIDTRNMLHLTIFISGFIDLQGETLDSYGIVIFVTQSEYKQKLI